MACLCPPGYTLLADGITCEKITTALPTPPETAIPIDVNIEGGGNMGSQGLLIHENVSSNQMGGSKQWPILDTPQNSANAASLSTIPAIGPNWTSISPAPTLPDDQHQPVNLVQPGGYPPLGMPNYPGSCTPGCLPTCLRESIVVAGVLNYGVSSPVMPTVWQNSFPWQTGFWGNAIGVWPSDALLTNFKWVGVSACVTVVDAPKTYYVLMACNNAFRFSVNGQLAVERNVGDGLTVPLGYVNAFPITLPIGTHTFYFEGFNYSGGGQFAVDLLDIDEPTLLAINTLPGIDPYRVFSTLWRKPRAITFTAGGTTITSVGLFTIHDVGAFIDAPGFSPTAYIVNVIDANTAIISEVSPPVATGGQLYFVWDTGSSAENAWTCPEGFLFGNCNGPECRLVETAECEEPPVSCYLLTACDGSLDPIVVTNDLSSVVGQVLNLCPADFPNRVIGPDQGVPIIFSPQTDNTNNYTLTDCCGLLPDVVITNGLDNVPPGGVLVIPSLGAETCWTYVQGTFTVSNVVDLTGALYYNNCATCNNTHPCVVYPVVDICTCFTVSLAPDCVGAITLLLPVIPIPYANCAACLPVCYLLTNCEDPLETIKTYTDFSDYVGMVIKLLASCPDKCWIVSIAPDCIDSISVQQSIQFFADCVSCLPPVLEIPINLKTRAVKPGFYTPGCPPDYTVKVKCKFAEAVYRELLVKKYGVTPCCDEDDHKWDLKKSILELNALYDPEACKSSIQKCCPPTCLDVQLVVFRPVSCAPPDDLVVTLLP